MNKTDKELAVELAIAVIQGWDSRNGTTPINQNQAVAIADTFYKAIKNWD